MNEPLIGCFVTGTDTDSGKTTVTAALLRELLSLGLAALAIKPVQTGCIRNKEGQLTAPDVDCYTEAVQNLNMHDKPLHEHAQAKPLPCPAKALRLFEPACSPHLAARLAGEQLEVRTLAQSISQQVSPPLHANTSQDVVHTFDQPEDHGPVFTLVEGAGGLYVPLNRDETMLDLMEYLGLPVVLVVPNRLGCLNHAHLSLEALHNKGLKVMGLVMVRVKACKPSEISDDCDAKGDPEYLLIDNEAALVDLQQRYAIPLLINLPFTAEVHSSQAQTRQQGWTTLSHILRPLAQRLCLVAQHLRLEEGLHRLFKATTLQSEQPAQPDMTHEWFQAAGIEHPPVSAAEILHVDRHHLWHPYTSVTQPHPVHEVVSAKGVRLRLRDGRELIDGMASWWSAIHGYGHPVLYNALVEQAKRMPHVMFGGLTHAPAVTLVHKILALLPDELEHVFLTDSGSVAVEVALKMALQYWQSMQQPHKNRMLALRGGYHGDTLGAMSVCDPVTGMHSLFAHVLPQHLFVERPTCAFDPASPNAFDPATLDPIKTALRTHAATLAAVILEPVVQGAGGMYFYHPRYLEGVARLCREHDVLLIADEIATGFGRTGKMFACEWANITPDILCLGKALTGGTMSLAATVATSRIARGIGQGLPQSGGGVFMHGPTFMANPLACAVACSSIDLLLQSPWQARVQALEQNLLEGLAACINKPGVADVRVLGAIGVVEMKHPVDVPTLQRFFVEHGVWIRPFGRAIYVMPPFVMNKADTLRLTAAMSAAVDHLAGQQFVPKPASVSSCSTQCP